jgi:hypothetical protein
MRAAAFSIIGADRSDSNLDCRTNGDSPGDHEDDFAGPGPRAVQQAKQRRRITQGKSPVAVDWSGVKSVHHPNPATAVHKKGETGPGLPENEKRLFMFIEKTGHL